MEEWIEQSRSREREYYMDKGSKGRLLSHIPEDKREGNISGICS